MSSVKEKKLEKRELAVPLAKVIIREELKETGVTLERIQNIKSGSSEIDTVAIEARRYLIYRLLQYKFIPMDLIKVLNRCKSNCYLLASDAIQNHKKPCELVKPSKEEEPPSIINEPLMRSPLPEHLIRLGELCAGYRYANTVDWVKTREEKRQWAVNIAASLEYMRKRINHDSSR